MFLTIPHKIWRSLVNFVTVLDFSLMWDPLTVDSADRYRNYNESQLTTGLKHDAHDDTTSA